MDQRGGDGVLIRAGRTVRAGNRVRLRTVEQPVERREQPLAAPPLPGDDADHRDAETALQQRKVEPQPAPLRFVQQIDAHEDAVRVFQDLQDQVQVPGEAGGVADHDDGTGLPGAEKVPGGRLLRRVRQEGVGPGQVHKTVPPPPVQTLAPGADHGLSRPVARVLAQASETVEHRAFPHVGVSRQRDDDRLPFVCRHRPPPPSSRQIWIRLLSASRSASTAPHTA